MDILRDSRQKKVVRQKTSNHPGASSVRKMLFHVSEQGGIERFEPRWSDIAGRKVVWAIDVQHLRNYLVPRDCPRVTYYAGPQTADADVKRFLGKARAVVAIENSWLERLRSCRLFCYHFLLDDNFECIDSVRAILSAISLLRRKLSRCSMM